MRRSLSHRILAIVLVIANLLLGDVMHLPAAQAAAHEPARPMMMMAGEPCPGMASASGHTVPVDDGSCCKSAQCPCLHAAALMVTLQMPPVFGISYAELRPTEVSRSSGPSDVFFRPPI